jgi:hypothetical protein
MKYNMKGLTHIVWSSSMGVFRVLQLLSFVMAGSRFNLDIVKDGEKVIRPGLLKVIDW